MNMAKINENENNLNSHNHIAVGTEITGDVTSNGDIRIDGALNGNLTTKGKVVIGETGKIKGEVNCKNSVVEGTVNGKIKVEELLSLKTSGKVNGDIFTNKLAIEPGSKFTGSCNMTGNPSIANEEKSDKEGSTISKQKVFK